MKDLLLPRWRKNSQARQHLTVYRSDDFLACSGANEGDGLSDAANLVRDDVYALEEDAKSKSLSICLSNSACQISPDSKLGVAGATIHFDCVATLMDTNLNTIEILILVETDHRGHAREVYILPLAHFSQKTEYRLIQIEPATAAKTFAHLYSVSFTRGTLVTLGSGRQCLVEELAAGDQVLTRDNGARHLLWVGQNTQRAVGIFAPIKIASGTLNNAQDLFVSPDHHLYFYQRTQCFDAGRAEVRVKARHLVNNTSVTVQEGGFVDYFQLLFDRHEIIYAHGIATESMCVDASTSVLFDHHLLDRLEHTSAPASAQIETDLLHTALMHRDPVGLLRRATAG